jgi:hypothetical protein
MARFIPEREPVTAADHSLAAQRDAAWGAQGRVADQARQSIHAEKTISYKWISKLSQMQFVSSN